MGTCLGRDFSTFNLNITLFFYCSCNMIAFILILGLKLNPNFSGNLAFLQGRIRKERLRSGRSNKIQMRSILVSLNYAVPLSVLLYSTIE